MRPFQAAVQWVLVIAAFTKSGADQSLLTQLLTSFLSCQFVLTNDCGTAPTIILEIIINLLMHDHKVPVFSMCNLASYRREDTFRRYGQNCVVHLALIPLVKDRTFDLGFPVHLRTNGKTHLAINLKRDVLLAFIDSDAVKGRPARYKYFYKPCRYPVNFLAFKFRAFAQLDPRPLHFETNPDVCGTKPLCLLPADSLTIHKISRLQSYEKLVIASRDSRKNFHSKPIFAHVPTVLVTSDCADGGATETCGHSLVLYNGGAWKKTECKPVLAPTARG